MAYQLNEEQLKAVRESARNEVTQKEDKSWLERSDNGYGDRYRVLMSKLCFVRERYMDQLKYLPRKKEELMKEHKTKLIHMLLAFFLPFIMEGFSALLIYPAQVSGFFSVLYFVFLYLITPVSMVTCFLYFVPVTTRDYFNCMYRVKKLNTRADVIYGADFWESMARDVEFGKRKNITFQEEEQFLKSILGYIDRFLKRAGTENLEHLGVQDDGTIEISDGYTKEQQEVIDTLETLGRHVDVQARIGDERKESGPMTLVVGMGIMMAVGIFILMI